MRSVRLLVLLSLPSCGGLATGAYGGVDSGSPPAADGSAVDSGSQGRESGSGTNCDDPGVVAMGPYCARAASCNMEGYWAIRETDYTSVPGSNSPFMSTQ